MKRETTGRFALFAAIVVWACALLASGCASPGPTARALGAMETNKSGLSGYLSSPELPLGFAPPAPEAGSAVLASDEETSRKALTLRNTPRWKLATDDADLSFPHAAGVFSCVLNAPITESETPRLYTLLQRALIDAGHSTSEAKGHYRRVRPFVVNKEPTCTPQEEEFLKTNGSYPSGHAAAGWAWALILAELAPDRSNAIFVRGRAFGENRVVCNVHWQNDVTEGSFFGAATVARLHANAAFRDDLEAARAELASVRAKGLAPVGDCAAEAAALAEWQP